MDEPNATPRTLRLLLVEDLEDDARLLLRELERAGWDVTHQRVDTEPAMATAIASGQWDIIISDYSMPCFGGLRALALARERASELPFILVSGTVGEEIAVQAMKGGANDYLFKGNLKRLGPAVARELREADLRRDARRTREALSMRERQLADAQRLARLGSWHVDVRGDVVVLSEEACSMLARQPGLRPPTLAEYVECIHPEDRHLVTDALRSPDATRFAHDVRIGGPGDAETRFVHIRGDIVRDARGDAIEAAGMIQDITERKAAEQELRKAHDALALAKEEAEAASRAKDQFLAILSHELRTPLTPVLAIVSHLERQPDVPEAVRGELAAVRRNVETEARLIDDLLDLTRIARDKVELHHEVVDVHAVVESVLECHRAEVEANRLQASIALLAEEHHVWGDHRRLRQVFTNVLSNAVKFTPPGGSISIRSVNNSSGRVEIKISDTGVGIEPEVLPRLFKSFQQGERTLTRRFGGLGLGLSIAKSFVELHNGRIAAASEGRDRGTTLTVELDPVAVDEGIQQRPEAAVLAPRGDDRLTCRGRRVLLVEDHADTRRAMSRLLTGFGCSVSAAGSVAEALELAGRDRFELLVSDIGLPDGTGMDVIRHVRKLYDIQGIAVSGFGQAEDLRRSREAGFAKHLIKPIDAQSLEATIREFVA